ncbi:MAG: gamma carbonic anhydrase family protein [Mariprofundaceae bacterium]|nr:gamma carbonic anhydrase family protein [Mariprofundaceae bacterium]
MITAFGGHTPYCNDTAFIAPSADIIGQVNIAAGASIWYQCVLRGDLEAIHVGEDSNIQEHSVLHTSHGVSPCIVGRGVTVGHRVLLHGCEIQDYCLVGMGSIVMDQAVLEEGCLLAAGSLVTERKVLRSGFLYAGSPAKERRPLSEKERDFLHHSAEHYVTMAARHREINAVDLPASP